MLNYYSKWKLVGQCNCHVMSSHYAVQPLRFQIPWRTNVWIHAQRSQESISNYFLLPWKLIRNYFLYIFCFRKTGCSIVVNVKWNLYIVYFYNKNSQCHLKYQCTESHRDYWTHGPSPLVKCNPPWEQYKMTEKGR